MFLTPSGAKSPKDTYVIILTQNATNFKLIYSKKISLSDNINSMLTKAILEYFYDFCPLGKRDPNPYWFNIEIFAVIASNTLKIRQVFSAVFSLYRQKSLMLNCSHLTLRCFSQDFSAAGCRQADACQIRQAERLQKHPSSGNACSSLVCLRIFTFSFSVWD